MDKTELSVIIVSYNTREILQNCIESIIKFKNKLNIEIILVDNNSKDGTVDEFKKSNSIYQKYKSIIKIIKNQSNYGFAKANNQGMRIAKGKYILLLNSDTLIETNVFQEMIDFIEEKNVGIVSSMLRNIDGSNQGTGGYFPSLFRVFCWMFFVEDIPFLDRFLKFFHPPHSSHQNNKFIELDWVTGAFFLFKRKLVGEIGYFDEDYFMYVEEVDFCYRAKQNNYRVLVNPNSYIIHLGGASGGSGFSIVWEFKNIKLFFKKHYNKWQYPILNLFLRTGSLLRAGLYVILKPELAKTYAKTFIGI